jgi:hypothetical protein
MAMTFDNPTIRSWAMKRPESAPTWWSRMAPSPEKEAFGKILFRGKQGLSEPMKEPTAERHGRAADYIQGNGELREILSAEINEEIARITDQIREGPPVLEPVLPAPEPAPAAKPARETARPGRKAPPAKEARPEPAPVVPAAKPGKAAPPEKPGKAAKPGKTKKDDLQAPAKDEKPAQATAETGKAAQAKEEKSGKAPPAKNEKPAKTDRVRKKS